MEQLGGAASDVRIQCPRCNSSFEFQTSRIVKLANATVKGRNSTELNESIGEQMANSRLEKILIRFQFDYIYYLDGAFIFMEISFGPLSTVLVMMANAC